MAKNVQTMLWYVLVVILSVSNYASEYSFFCPVPFRFSVANPAAPTSVVSVRSYHRKAAASSSSYAAADAGADHDADVAAIAAADDAPPAAGLDAADVPDDERSSAFLYGSNKV